MECHWQSIPSSKCWTVFHCMDRCTASRSLFLWSHILGLCLYRRHLNHLSQRRYELQHIDFVKPENYFLHLCYELSCILLQRLCFWLHLNSLFLVGGLVKFLNTSHRCIWHLFYWKIMLFPEKLTFQIILVNLKKKAHQTSSPALYF